MTSAAVAATKRAEFSRRALSVIFIKILSANYYVDSGRLLLINGDVATYGLCKYDVRRVIRRTGVFGGD
jgi:hypothetical protein